MSGCEVSNSEYDAKTIYELKDEVKRLKETIERLKAQVLRLEAELSREEKFKRALNLLADSMKNLTETD